MGEYEISAFFPFPIPETTAYFYNFSPFPQNICLKEDDIKHVMFIWHTFSKINDSCLQFWGGMGFTNDVEISRSYRWKKDILKDIYRKIIKTQNITIAQIESYSEIQSTWAINYVIC